MFLTYTLSIIRHLALNVKYGWCAVWSWENWMSTKVVTKNMQSNRWPLNSWVFCRMHWARAPWGQLDWYTMFCICTEQMRSWTLHFGIWHWLWSFLQNIGTFPPDYILLHSRRRISSVTATSTSKYSCLVIIYCLLLTVFSTYTKTGTFLNVVLATVLTL